jgi:hypothetical protein
MDGNKDSGYCPPLKHVVDNWSKLQFDVSIGERFPLLQKGQAKRKRKRARKKEKREREREKISEAHFTMWWL